MSQSLSEQLSKDIEKSVSSTIRELEDDFKKQLRAKDAEIEKLKIQLHENSEELKKLKSVHKK